MSTAKHAKALSKWDEAIRDAQKHIRRLEAAIRTLKEKKEKGEIWPTEGCTKSQRTA